MVALVAENLAQPGLYLRIRCSSSKLYALLNKYNENLNVNLSLHFSRNKQCNCTLEKVDLGLFPKNFYPKFLVA